jgi:ABC-2 type transport system permease protein
MTVQLNEQPATASPHPATDSRRPLSGWQVSRIVAAREIAVRLRDKAFVISSIFLLVLVAAATILPSLFAGGPTAVAASGPAAASALAAAGDQADLDIRPVADDAAAETAVRNGDVDAAVVVDGTGSSPLGVEIVALDEAPDDLVAALSVASPVRLLDPAEISPGLAFLIPFAFAIVFFMTTLAFGYSISQSVVEEKQTRVVEILVAAIPVRAMLTGKVLGNAVLAAGQIALIVVVAVVGLVLSGSELLSGKLIGQLGGALAWFVPFFLIGFLMLAGLWAVSGSLVSRMEDLGSTTTVVQLLVMLPFFVVTYGSSNPELMVWLSYVPFSAPIAMPVRVFQGETAGIWEPLLSLLILAATTVACVLLAARLYEGSLLRTNGKTKLGQAWKGARPGTTGAGG